jgi:anti-sigma factor RsiW
MNDKKICPTQDLLYDFVEGKIPEPEQTELAIHLEHCTECQASAEAITSTDTLVETLRGG